MKYLSTFFAFAVLMFVNTNCKSHKLLATLPCPAKSDSSAIYAEIFYHYKYLKIVPREKINDTTINRIDSLFSFTTTVSGHEGWSINNGAKHNDYYHPEYFVLENPNVFPEKPRNDHHFSLYCPNELSEMIRRYINNDLEKQITELELSVRPYAYVYNKKKKAYHALVRVSVVDTSFFK